MSEQLTVGHVQYVRERWPKSGNGVQVGDWGWLGDYADHEGWQAAYTFTLKRERDIKEKREELWWLEHAASFYDYKNELAERILSILEAQLADLLKGFKERSHDA